ncbi:hypothetical protein V8E51_017660 [Hyaloscypha variabilis]
MHTWMLRSGHVVTQNAIGWHMCRPEQRGEIIITSFYGFGATRLSKTPEKGQEVGIFGSVRTINTRMGPRLRKLQGDVQVHSFSPLGSLSDNPAAVSAYALPKVILEGENGIIGRRRIGSHDQSPRTNYERWRKLWYHNHTKWNKQPWGKPRTGCKGNPTASGAKQKGTGNTGDLAALIGALQGASSGSKNGTATAKTPAKAPAPTPEPAEKL